MASAKFPHVTLLSSVSQLLRHRFAENDFLRNSVEQLNLICWRERFRDGHRYVHHSLHLQLKVESIRHVGGE